MVSGAASLAWRVRGLGNLFSRGGLRLEHPQAGVVRAFGKTDLRVSAYGLGCARIGGIFQRDSSGFVELLCAAHDAGINFFDTADMYSQGESEALLGRAFRRRRGQVIIASKAGYCLPTRRRLAARLKPLLRPVIQLLKIRRDRLPVGTRGALSQDFSPRYLRQAVEGSLRRLRTDYLDLFQLHSPPTSVVERGEWEPALEALKRAGKIRYYGVACDTVETGLAALRYPGVSSLQFTLNLLERRAVDTLLPQARAKGAAFIARECLSNGLLVKRADEVDLAGYWATADEQTAKEEELAKYRRLAVDSNRPLARLALEYVGGVEGVSVSLLGARSVEQLRGLLGHLRRPEAPDVRA
jgi:aryl-alcohol dehydrogenase-like predicted oxidoreductase